MDANSTVWTPTAQYGRQQHNMDANSTMWTPTANMDDKSTMWTPTAQYGRQQLMIFRGNSPKICQNCEKFAKKDVKESKNSPFLVNLSSFYHSLFKYL
jgi:hypothetical protein